MDPFKLFTVLSFMYVHSYSTAQLQRHMHILRVVLGNIVFSIRSNNHDFQYYLDI